MRVVLDTNVMVSGFLSETGAPAGILAHWEQQTFELLISEPILAEYDRVLRYPHVQARHKRSPADLDRIIARFREFALLVTPVELPVVITADPDDDRFLTCAVAGGADYIISGDTHLLRLRDYAGIPILAPAVFLTVLRQQDGP